MPILKRLALFSSLAMLISSPAFAQSSCHDDQISNTSGRMINLTSGWVMLGYPGTNATLSFWTPLDKVVVCPIGGAAYSITNVSKSNKMIKAIRKTS